VTAIEAPGLDLMRQLGVCAHEVGRRVAVVCPDGPIRRALAHAGVDERLEIYTTVSAAHYGREAAGPCTVRACSPMR
jgi:hypothetical protein